MAPIRLTRRTVLRGGLAAAALGPSISRRSGITSAAATGAAAVSRYQPDGAAERQGFSAAGLDRVAELFAAMLDEQLHPGAQLAVYRGGELVIELCGGVDDWPGQPVTPKTLFQIRSTTKALATIVMLREHGRGRFAFDDPVAKHWPEFAQNGKEAITIAHVMSHRAGIPDGPLIPADEMGDRAAVAAAVAAMTPIWEPGAANGYHAATFGWVLQELVLRWEDRRLDEVLRSEVLEPLGIGDVILGLSREDFDRMAKMVVDPDEREKRPQRARFSDFINTYEGARLPLAWVMGMATARDLGRLMDILAHDGTAGGKRYVSEESLTLASMPTNPGGFVDLRLQHPVRWGLGFILGSTPDVYGTGPHPGAVGHAGGGASVAWADPDERLAVAFLCNRMLGRESWERYRRMGDAVYAAFEPA